ncbi:hypothetical protein N7501_011955 [Penicillium viridicatum]|nr:hypothetical protein N7501_011955 [Penicillium viridicatum]
MPNPLPEFSPACPIPYILQPKERVKQLQAVLDTDFGQAQRVNIEALIHLYEIGELGPRQQTDPPVFLVDGVCVEKDPWQDKSVPADALRWCELYAQIRIPPQYGGDANLSRYILICNDTGSNVLTIFDSDLRALNFSMARYLRAIRGSVQVNTANRWALQTLMFVEMQIVTSTFVPLTPWFEESAIVKADTPGDRRLLGAAMRNYLFFATAPGNAHLYVAQKKAGIIRDLSAV